MSEIFAKVKSIIMDKLGSDDEEVNLESNLIQDLGADSLDVLELVVEIEKEFDIQIPNNIAEEITTVSQIVEYVEKHI